MKNLDISSFNYDLPDERIARYPLAERDESKLLVFKNGVIGDDKFSSLFNHIHHSSMLVFNQTKVVRARIVMHRATGARIEIFCLEPSQPANYEQAFAAVGHSSWHCMVGNAKKFNHTLTTDDTTLSATRGEGDVVHFEWTTTESFGALLERLGQVPIPPYLRRASEQIDQTRYQTTYARVEGSVAAPTAGLHFSQRMIDRIAELGLESTYITLHVGAGTFLPVKEQNAAQHTMHIEKFEVNVAQIEQLAKAQGRIIAVGTTSVRTLESLAILGGRLLSTGALDIERPVGQWESYPTRSIAPLAQYMRQNSIEKLEGATQIMITPGFTFATISGLITNFHQPKSTLLLLISAIVGDKWHDIYAHALENDYRFLSYGDSSLLML